MAAIKRCCIDNTSLDNIRTAAKSDHVHNDKSALRCSHHLHAYSPVRIARSNLVGCRQVPGTDNVVTGGWGFQGGDQMRLEDTTVTGARIPLEQYAPIAHRPVRLVLVVYLTKFSAVPVLIIIPEPFAWGSLQGVIFQRDGRK